MEFKTRGNRLYSQGKTLEAIEAYSEGINFLEEEEEEGSGGGSNITEEDRGCRHLLYCNRSMAELDACLVDEALQDSELAIEANPNFAKAYVRRAEVLLNLFKNQEALADLDTAEELEPGIAPPGCEARRRASGERWFPNCFLQKQKELTRKYQCDYVLLLEHEGVHIEEPIKITGGGLNLKRCIATGQHLVGVLDFLERQPTKAKSEIVLDPPGEYKKLIQQQLEREYGANNPDITKGTYKSCLGRTAVLLAAEEAMKRAMTQETFYAKLGATTDEKKKEILDDFVNCSNPRFSTWVQGGQRMYLIPLTRAYLLEAFEDISGFSTTDQGAIDELFEAFEQLHVFTENPTWTRKVKFETSEYYYEPLSSFRT